MAVQAQPIDSITAALQSLAGNAASSVPMPTIQPLSYTAPSLSDISQQFQTFLNRAASDPDIINYYNKLINTAEGDYNTAIGFLQSDYATGVRQTVQTLSGDLQSLAQQNTTNQVTQQDALNKRGMAVTQNADGSLGYAGGGEAGTEVNATAQNYALQQEAKQRSANQSVQNYAQTLQKNTSQQGQTLTNAVQGYQTNYNTDVGNRANMYMGLYNQQQTAAEQAAQNKLLLQQNTPPPAMPTGPMEMGQIQGNYKWTGSGWAWN